MTAGEGPPCAVLDWDSAFFGFPIGRLLGDRVTPADAAAAVAWAYDHAIDCLYALVDADHTPSLRALEAQQFALADVRLTLDRDVDPRDGRSHDTIRDAAPADREPLLALARVSHLNTRFTEDPRFGAARSAELYARWLSNALAEPDAMVLVPHAGGRASGYLTLHRTSQPEAHIGLLAVAADARGLGLGAALVDDGLRRLHDRGARRVTVVTQGRSAPAVRFYEQCGFRVRACQFWYHRWFER